MGQMLNLPFIFGGAPSGNLAPQFYYTIPLHILRFRLCSKKILRNFPKLLDKRLTIVYNRLNRKGKGKADFPDKEIVGYGM